MGPSAIRYAGLDERIVELGRRCEDWGDVVTAVAEASAVGDERMRYPARRSRRRRANRRAGRAGGGRALPAAGARRRPLGRARLARRHGSRPGPGRRALARRARRPEPARDLAERQRPRDAARGCARPRRAGVRERRLPLPAVEPRRVALVGVRSLDPGERDAAGRARGAGVHDERPRPDGRRDRDARGAGARQRRRVRPPQPGPGRARSRGRARRGHAGSRRALLPGGAPGDGADRRVGSPGARSRWSR